ncbi:MAG: Ribosomal silencing factor RsfS [Firmicutes bacterium ADurb.Bin182]|nr:MAG: Ribosomal silencing factor RsfS [Firmicutes bacterium ADurb.Bin182]
MESATRERVLSICRLLYDKKAQDIIAIDVEDKTILAEWFIICSGRASTQVKALCDEIEQKSNEMGLKILRKEGYRGARWIVLDFGNILLHIFHEDERKYYNMERLWMDDLKSAILFSKEEDAKLDSGIK